MTEPTIPTGGPGPTTAPPPGAPPPSTSKVKENTQGLARVLLIVLIAVGCMGGLYALVATTSALRAIGMIPAVIVAMIPVVGLPLFLTIRAGLALKRRGMGAVVRRLVAIALVLLTHLAIIGVVSEWVGRTSGDMFATSYLVLEEVGGIPYISPMLKRAAKERNALPLPGDGDTPPNAIGPDGGPVAPTTTGDGGVAIAKPTPPPATDPAIDPKGVDAGVAVAAVAAVPAGAFSPRSPGGARTLFAASTGRDSQGNAVVLAHSLFAKGEVQTRRLSLAAFRADGSVRLVETANDGHLAVLLSSGVVLAAPPAGSLAKVPALGPKAQVTTPDGAEGGAITTVRDVVIGPGGDLVAVVDIAASRGKAPVPSLVSAPLNGATATLIRQRGDVVDAAATAAEGSALKANDFSFRRGTGTDRFVVVESMVAAISVRTKLSGKVFEMNPQRLMVGSTRAPAGMREVARTGTALIGIPNRSLQAFQDAVALADGRVLFDANFAEAGKNGWVFVATAGDAQAYAVQPKLFPSRAAYNTSAPRARSLAASDDVFAFVGGTAEKTSLGMSPIAGSAVSAKIGSNAVKTGANAGTYRVVQFRSVALADTADWLLVGATVRGDDGKERAAVLLASKADLEAATFEVVTLEGVGDAAITRLNFREDRRDALWLVAP